MIIFNKKLKMIFFKYIHQYIFQMIIFNLKLKIIFFSNIFFHKIITYEN